MGSRPRPLAASKRILGVTRVTASGWRLSRKVGGGKRSLSTRQWKVSGCILYLSFILLRAVHIKSDCIVHFLGARLWGTEYMEKRNHLSTSIVIFCMPIV